jgi:hypothetical protein
LVRGGASIKHGQTLLVYGTINIARVTVPCRGVVKLEEPELLVNNQGQSKALRRIGHNTRFHQALHAGHEDGIIEQALLHGHVSSSL